MDFRLDDSALFSLLVDTEYVCLMVGREYRAQQG
jgi:hypothetical protein